MIVETAPAKINLALHVTGRRADGYHLIDTLVVFADLGDTVTVSPADDLSLTIDGPFAGNLEGTDDNLVMRAARMLAEVARDRGLKVVGARLNLTKNLPVASGIGGGSADAAATLRALNRLWELQLETSELAALGEPLGADVPMCVSGEALRATGIGTELHPTTGLPRLSLVLVNPGIAVSTPDVFKALSRRENAALPEVPETADLGTFCDYLTTCRNDLEETAIGLSPAIADTLAQLNETDGCRLARMSGSGATCYGVYASDQAATNAAQSLKAARPDWWITATQSGPAPDYSAA